MKISLRMVRRALSAVVACVLLGGLAGCAPGSPNAGGDKTASSAGASNASNSVITHQAEGATGAADSPVAFTAPVPVREVCIDGYTVAAIAENGDLWMWGLNEHGQIGDGTLENANTPVKVLEGVEQVDVESGRVAALKDDGSLWMWGLNSHGQIGDGLAANVSDADGQTVQCDPTPVLEDVASFDLARDFTGALKSDGTLWMWGANGNGQLGNNGQRDGTYYDEFRDEETAIQTVPVQVLSNVVDFEMGDARTAAILSDNSLWVWGLNQLGELGTKKYVEEGGYSTLAPELVPVQILDDVESVMLGEYYSAAIKTNGELWAWGDNGCGEVGVLGDGGSPAQPATIYIPALITDNVREVSYTYTGIGTVAIVKNDGSLWMCGANSYGGTEADLDELTVGPTKVLDDVKSVVLGDEHTAAVKNDGSLWMWGHAEQGFPASITPNATNSSGEKMQTVPVQVLDDVSEVRLMDLYPSCRVAAVKADGSLWSWGANYNPNYLGYGCLGNGSTEDVVDPVKIMDGLGSIEHFDNQNTIVRLENGRLVAWGGNNYGQLGIGTAEMSLTPVYPLEEHHPTGSLVDSREGPLPKL